MPRKPKIEKQTIQVIVNNKPVAVTLFPPTATRRIWYAYWPGLKFSKSTGQTTLADAIVAAENMVKNGGQKVTVADALMSDEEFEAIQRRHFSKKTDPAAQARAAKTLEDCLDAITAFRDITGLKPITLATPDDCERFQQQAQTLPKNWRQKHLNSKSSVGLLSPNTVLKWSRSLQAAFERVNRSGGRKCVRGVVDQQKLLGGNPWNQFTWIGGTNKPIRQFDHVELLSLLDHFQNHWPEISVGPLVAKVCLWSWSRREEVMSLQWSMLRTVDDERHFEIEGKRGVKKWFRVPDGLFGELVKTRSDSPFVFAAYTEQIKRYFENSKTPGPAKNVEGQFKPENLGNWFYKKLVKWSQTLPKGKATIHVFRKTSLQYARAGEDVNRQVAADAKLGEAVMTTHYVRESDVQMRNASNRTFHRILASLPSPVAARYGHVEPQRTDLEKRLDEARTSKNWELVTRLSNELIRCGRGTTG
ncbi:MAG: hypothetical protein JNM56_14060 [Planctomycetia bacterium]|nr:hypothetical protein [Planctomycetia bacterium]